MDTYALSPSGHGRLVGNYIASGDPGAFRVHGELRLRRTGESTMLTMSPLQRQPVSYTPEEASALAVAAAGLAGFPASDSVRDLLARMDRGELNEDEAAAEVAARFTRPGFPEV